MTGFFYFCGIELANQKENEMPCHFFRIIMLLRLS